MRGIAAILVMLFHYYNRDSIRAFGNTFIAVDFFFILSGFVITHSYGLKLSDGMPASKYLSRRVGRLYPVMAIGILLGIPVLLMQIKAKSYDLSIRELIVATISNLSMLPFLNGNTKMLESNRSVTGQIFPSDDPLWSIFAEMIASVLFIYLIKLDVRQLTKFCLISAMVFVLSAGLNGILKYQLFDVDMGWDTVSILGLFPRVAFGFSCGMLIYLLSSSAAPREESSMSYTLLLYGSLLAILLFPFKVDGLYAIAAVLLLAPLLVLYGARAHIQSKPIVKLSSFLGWASFPIYCLHRPIMSIVQYESTILLRPAYGSRMELEPIAIAATFVASAALAWAFDRIQVQTRLANTLFSGFSLIAER